MRVLRLIEVVRGRSSIAASCALDDLRFHATVWYEDVDLDELARKFGAALLDRIAVHVALFQTNAFASLRPDVIDLGQRIRAGRHDAGKAAEAFEQSLGDRLHVAARLSLA